MFDSLYQVRDSDRRPFGDNWIGPDGFQHWEETLVARYEARPDSDGQTVEVYCAAAPARFHTLKVLAGANSIGKPQAGYEVTTGSGQGELVAMLAGAIREGMIGFKSEEQLEAVNS